MPCIYNLALVQFGAMARTKKVTVKSDETFEEVGETSTSPSKSIFKSKLMYLLLVAIIATALFYFKGLFVAALVNGQPISRLSVVKQLEKEGGKQVLDTIITDNLILQEAQKEKVTASSAEITDQINQISDNLKGQGQDLDTALKAQGMTKQDLNDQIKLKVLVDKMAGKDITVTDKEIQDSFNQNQSTYSKGTKLESVRDQIKSALTQQKLNTSINTWITNLKSKAKINYFVSY